MLKYDFYRDLYLPSNETIENFVLCDLDLNFQDQTIHVIILTIKHWKMQTLLLPSDRKSDICQRMAVLQMLYIMTLTHVFEVTNFEM